MCGPRGALALAALAACPLGASAWLQAPAIQEARVPVAELRRQLRGAAAAAPEAFSSPSELPPLASWTRALLAGAAVVAAAIVSAPGTARAEGSVNVFFGQGCFWHVQHDLVKKEVSELGRKGGEITALAGYAGGTQVGGGGRVCYHNLAMAPDYGQMGHTEVVNVAVPQDKVKAFAKEFFDAANGYPMGRADPQDRGTEYRSAIGIPGGMDGPLFKEIEEANAGRMKLLRGEGNDRDTVATKNVWIYDSDKFPFYQGEVYHQFHDDMLERYSDSYHKLKNVLLDGSKIKKVECPEMGF